MREDLDMKASRIAIVAVVALVGGLGAGCSVRNESYCCTSADCADNVPCSDPARPFCDNDAEYPAANGVGRTCIADPLSSQCEDPNDCTNAARPFCVDQMCVECEENPDCSATAPVCDEGSHLCGVCTIDDECAGRADEPRCFVGEGECVSCLEAADCASASAPICDDTDHSCRGCNADTECTSMVCDEESGECIAEASIIYLATTGSGSACTQAAPCATFALGLAQVSGPRNTIKAGPGTYTGRLVLDNISVTIVGDGATVQPALTAQSVVDVQNGAVVTIEGLTITGTTGAGTTIAVRCLDTTPASTLRLHGTKVTANFGGGGVSIANCQFSVVNNLIAVNGTTASPFGGVRISDITAAGEHELAFNTITANAGASNSVTGVACSTISPMLTFANNIVYDNPTSGSGTQVGGDTECVWAYSDIGPQAQGGTGVINAAPMFVDAGGNDFHILAGSPAQDAADEAATEAYDIDGEPRPQGDRHDMGADEVLE